MKLRKVCIVLAVVLIAGTMVWAGGSKEAASPAGGDKPAAQGFDWKQFSGKTIVACFPNHVHYNAAMPLIPEFEKLTGIKVEVDLQQYIKMHDKQVLAMSAPSNGDYDIVSMVVMWKAEYAKAGLIQQLDPFFAKKNLQVPGYDFNDLVPAYVENTGYVDGRKVYLGGPGAKLYGVPFGAETSILIYRKDLFDQYKVKVPETYDELLAAAKFFHEKGIGGLTMRGASGHNATHAWLLHASPFGATIFDENWEPAITKPEAIQTINFMREMVKYGPPGIPGFDQDGEFAAFLQGNAAMYLNAVVFTGVARDPKRSKVTDKLGFALHPRAKNNLSETGGFGIAIPRNAKNPDAAFLFMQWLTMKETERKVILNGGAPFRMSSVNDKELQAKYPEFKVLSEQLKFANPDWRPIIPEWGEINTLVGTAVNQALTGSKTPEEAMQSVVAPIREIVLRAGYIKK